MEGKDAAPGTTTDQKSTSDTDTSPATNGAAAAEKDGGADRTAAPAGEQGGPPAKRPLKRSTRIGLSIIGVLALLAALGFGGAYFLYSRNYVTTDNAQVDGDKIEINAPATGTLRNWNLSQGAQVRQNQVVGRIEIEDSFAQPQRTIRSPGNGTVAVDNGVEGSWVTAGTQLATAYDFSRIYITARVDETDVRDVQVGALVDIDVDAYSGVAMTGIVDEVQGAAADVFSMFPESNSTGNFQKVTQVIPVKIGITNTQGRALVPGMNVTVHIHKPK